MLTDIPFTPLPHQREFVESERPTVLLEVGRGGGGSTALAIAAISDAVHPRHRALIIFPEHLGDGFQAAAKLWYTMAGGTYAEHSRLWAFPTGARVYVLPDGEANHRWLGGLEVNFLGFDLIDAVHPPTARVARDRLREHHGLAPRLRAIRSPGMDWIGRMFPRVDRIVVAAMNPHLPDDVRQQIPEAG